MAEEEKEGAADEKASRKSNKGLLIVIAIITLAAVGGGAGYFFLVAGKSGGAEHAEEKKPEMKSVLIGLDPFVLNLAEQGRFLKVTMQLELSDVTLQTTIAEKTPQLRDAIITLVSSKSAESLSSPEGKFQIKDELLLRANQALGKNAFKNLYFTEFVMQ